MKKHLFKIAGFLLIFPMFVFAAYTDVSLDSSDTIINTAGINITVSGTTASIDSITVGADSFEVIMSGSAYIQVASSDRRTLTVTGATGSATQSFSCTSAESTLTLSNPASGAQVTLTVTPSSSACTVSGGSSGGGGGSSGGGGGSAPVVPPQTATPATPAVSTQTPATSATPSSKAKPSSKALTVSFAFNKTLKVGSAGNDVKRLQQILNSDLDTKVADKGAGSPGKETTLFGSATRNALQKFQEKYRIATKGVPGYGTLGPATRAKIAELFAKEDEKPKQELKTETKSKTKTTAKKKTIKKKTTKSSSESLKIDLEKQMKELQDMLKKLGA